MSIKDNERRGLDGDVQVLRFQELHLADSYICCLPAESQLRNFQNADQERKYGRTYAPFQLSETLRPRSLQILIAISPNA